MIEPNSYNISNNLNQKWSSYVYGEINSKSFIDVLTKFNFDNRNLLDIGSGTGRLIYDLNKSFKNIDFTGIEIDYDRYNNSLNIETNNTNFIYGDFKDLYFGNYDIIYCCNCVFEIEDNDILFEKIIREFNGHCFLFSFNHKMLPYYIESYVIQTSWVPYTELYYFIIP